MSIRDTVEQLRPALDAWGRFVVDRIQELVKLEVGDDRFPMFFKVQPSFRLKDSGSAERKQEKKRYANPAEQMTDLVGARFVVLLQTDISLVERVIQSHTAWAKRKDRDPIDERDEKPTHFDYQSVHYILRNNKNTDLYDVNVPEGIACEVQIRTLLQHAYAELVHDKFYKAVKLTPPSARRLVARSMALMETTDQMFCEAVRELELVNQEREQWCALVDEEIGPLIPNFTRTDHDADALEILDTFKDVLDAANRDEVKAMKSAPIVAKIQQRAAGGGLFAKPVVLIVYWLVKEHGIELDAHWPLPALLSDIGRIKSDLGIGDT